MGVLVPAGVLAAGLGVAAAVVTCLLLLLLLPLAFGGRLVKGGGLLLRTLPLPMLLAEDLIEEEETGCTG